MAFLDVDRINVFYEDLQALWEVSLKLEKGELVSLIGSNGAGKSTTLKAILGIVRVKSGEIRFDGRAIVGDPTPMIVEEGVAYVPEGRRLFADMTVLENLEMGAFTKRTRAHKDENLKEVFTVFPILNERKSQLAATLSGGEAQMLALGRGLMAQPKLLMLDEPSAGLAPMVAAKIFEAIRRVNNQGTSILMVEQDVARALSVSNRAYVIENGRVVLEGDRESLLNNEYVRMAYLGV